MGTVTIDLRAAGLTHAKGKSDSCGNEHAVDARFVTRDEDDKWIPADRLEPLFQTLHEQAHPDGTVYWENCLEPVCTDAQELLSRENS